MKAERKLLAPDDTVQDYTVGDETSLLERLRRGDAAAAREFYDLYSARIHRFILHALGPGNDSDAENILQETFMALAEAMCERSVTVPNAVFEEVRRHFDEKAIIELVAMIALENMRACFNRALEIPSDELCQLPDNHPALQASARR